MLKSLLFTLSALTHTQNVPVNYKEDIKRILSERANHNYNVYGDF